MIQLRRGVIARFGIAAALGGLALMASANSALAQDIDTTALANNAVCNLASPPGGGLQTIGQTITIPAGQGLLTGFAFEMATVPSSVVFRGEVYAWDTGTSRATGPALYSTMASSTTGASYQLFSVTPPGGVAVTAGDKYVIFVSTSADAGTGTGAMECGGNVYADGDLVTLNSGASTAAWTGSPWSVNPAGDLGFTASFAPAPPPNTIPTLSEWAMILFGLTLAGGAAVLVQRRRLGA